jgi:integrase/recombinase XerC
VAADVIDLLRRRRAAVAKLANAATESSAGEPARSSTNNEPSQERAPNRATEAEIVDPPSGQPQPLDLGSAFTEAGLESAWESAERHLKAKGVEPVEVLERAAANIVRVTGGALDANGEQRYGPDEVFRRFLMNRAEDTLKAYKADVDAFAVWLGVTPDEAVGHLLGHGGAAANALAIEWLDSMAALAPSTRKRRLCALRSFVRIARRLGAVDWALDVDSPKVEAYRNTAGPTEQEFHRLFAACGDGLEGLRNRAIVLLATFMGWRRRELAAFTLSDYDRDRRRLFVRGKGGRSKWVGAPDEVIDALEAWLAAPKTIVNTEKVFLSLSRRSFGNALTRKGINTLVTRIGERAGVKVWPHAFRHAGVTAVLDESGGDVRMAQQFARHGDPKTTMLYDDNRKDMAGAAARLVANKLMPK